MKNGIPLPGANLHNRNDALGYMTHVLQEQVSKGRLVRFKSQRC